LEVVVVGLFYKVGFPEFSQLAWKVGTVCSTKTMSEMRETWKCSPTSGMVTLGAQWRDQLTAAMEGYDKGVACLNVRIQAGSVFK
jgi:hypothetical protein